MIKVKLKGKWVSFWRKKDTQLYVADRKIIIKFSMYVVYFYTAENKINKSQQALQLDVCTYIHLPSYTPRA